MTVEVLGLAEAARGMTRWADELAPAVDRAAVPLATRAAAQVRMELPRRSGRLAASVRVAVDAEGVAVTMGTGVPYAGWVEYGGTRGRPYVDDGRYLAPTVETFEDPYITLAAATATATVERFPWSAP